MQPILCKGIDNSRERKIQCDPRFGHLPFIDKNRKNTFEMKRSWQTFLLMHISLQLSELPDRLLSIIRAPKGYRFISKVKYPPSAKKKVKPKQVITFVLLLERSDGFLLCGEDAPRAEDRASGFFWELAHKENSEDYLLSAHLSTTHHKGFFLFLSPISFNSPQAR